LPPTPEGVTGGLLLRAGVSDPAQVMAVEAEDHYLRLHLADGRKPLVLYRLRDALAELSPLDGEQVHRGYWVAGRAVRGLERRDGRKWALRLEGGLLVPVSATFMPTVRKRGWQELVL
jgi:DNA-binding LytR/AlgR family response regulator